MTAFGAKWWAVQPQGRRPVSRGRRAMGLLFLLLIVLGGLGYRAVTDEDRLRRYAEQWLANFSGGDVRIARVDFNLFGGLHLVGVTIAVPEEAEFFPGTVTVDERTLFSASTVLLRLQPFSIITGDLAVPQIVAVNPRLTLIGRADGGESNWAAMLARRTPGKPGKGPPRLPDIRLRNLEVRQYRLDARGRVGGSTQTFYAGARPDPDRPEVYDLHVTKIVGDEHSEQWWGEEGRLQIDMQNGMVSGSLPSLSLDELRLAAPPEIDRWLELLELSGTVRAETFSFDPQTGARARLRLNQARLSVPIDERESGDRAAERYIQFSGVAGVIEVDEQQAAVELEGSFRDSPIRLSGRLLLSGEATGLAGIGLALDLTASALPLPRCDEETSEPEKRFVRRWPKLANFVRDFDGRGLADLQLKLHKEPGLDKGIQFLGGKLTVRGASAAFDEFPYRLYDMSGEVHFLADGKVDLVRLAGHHGGGRVEINGKVGGFSSHDSVRLDIQGRNISLDGDLLEHLAADDRALCQRFLERAQLDLDIRMTRPETDRSGPRGTWESRVDATFLDGSFMYPEFPYPLEQLRGRVRIAGGLLRLEGLTGRRGDTTVRVSGTADRDGGRAGTIDVRLQAEQLALDETLQSALPAEVREVFERYGPQGAAEVSGRLYTDSSGGPLQFDLGARLDGAELDLPGGGGRLSDVRATLRLVPGQLEVTSLTGRLGSSMLVVKGSVGLSGEQASIKLEARSDALELDETLRAVLPEAMQAVYDSLAPQGRVRFELQYASGAGTAPANAKDGATPSRSTDTLIAVVEPLDCKVTFDSFPLPLDSVRGKVVFTSEGTFIEQLTARHGEIRLLMSGRVNTGEAPVAIEIDYLEARNVAFTEALRQALPWRLKRMWHEMRPTGVCDLLLRDIRVAGGEDGDRRWTLDGRVELRGVGLAAGPQLDGMHGTLEGFIGHDGQFHADTRLAVSEGRVDGRVVRDVVAKVQRASGSSMLRITDMQGNLYGGTLIGQVEVDYAVQPPRFAMKLSGRHVSLEEFLAADDDPEQKPVELKGSVEGTLSLSGQFGDARSRQGSGSIVIHDAQMAKLPMILGIMQIVHMAIEDDNAFHDALFDFIVDGDDLVLNRIDLRGKAISMVGAGRIQISTRLMHLILLVGSPLNLPRLRVLSDLLEGVARELMEVHVEGTVDAPLLRAEVARSLRRTVERMSGVLLEQSRPGGLRGRGDRGITVP